MSGQLALSFALKFNDQGSGPAARALQLLTRGLKETESTAKATSAAAVAAFQKLASAREVLGIRSEKAIQNEIHQTQAAYRRLAASGTASARELSRAQDALRRKVAELRAEMGKTQVTAAGMARGVVQGVAGVQAAKYVMAGPMRETMSYDIDLAHVSNTMYAGRTVAERVASKAGLNDAVMAAVRAAKGGSREQSLDALKAMAASGEFGNDPQGAIKALPSVVRAAVATGSSATELANIAIKAKANMGLSNFDRVYGMAAKGGIEGQFELRDMAKWLPQQMAYAKRTGLNGEEGFAKIVAMNQLAMTTAGSADEAGNNVRNLLAKINSADTAADAKKLGIDLSGSLAAAQAKGTGGVDAFLNLVERVASQDKRLTKLREEAKTATGADLKSNLMAQIGILEGSAIGKLIQDQQSMSGLVPLLNQRDRFDKTTQSVLNEKDTIGELHPVIAATEAAKAQLAAAEKANAMHTAMGKLTPLLGSAADGFSAFAQSFPTATAAVIGLGTAAAAAAAALAVIAGTGLVFGKDKGGSLLGRALETAMGRGSASTAGGTAVRTAGRIGRFGPTALAAAPLAALWGASEWAGDTSRDQERTKGLLGFSGWLGSFMPDPTRSARERYEAQRAERDPESQKVEVNLYLDGEQIARAINDRNGRDARRH